MLTLLDELSLRGLVQQCTDLEKLKEHLAVPRKVYAGFDPTASSLTIGNLIPIVILKHFQRAGHTPVVILGGATGLIGDPSGKTAERQLLTPEIVVANIEGQRRIFGQILDFNAPTNAALMLNNYDWISKFSFLEGLRDIGRYFRVNEMIKKESVKARLESEQGMSFTEFAYQLIQGWDFKHLCEHYGVTVQLGGSDQWGNITAGTELIRRILQQSVHGLTNPLVTKADGGKFGKSEGGAIWLTADRTTPYALYQFFLNTDDNDVLRFLKLFTFVPLAQLAEIEIAHTANPSARTAHRILAEEVTRLIHGDTAAKDAIQASQALFDGDISTLALPLILDVMAGVPTSTHKKESLREPLKAVDFLKTAGVCSSNREAREMLSAGAVTVNGRVLQLADTLSATDLLHDQVMAIRRGKKNWYLALWE